MSFSGNVKKEIASKPAQNACCIQAGCYGIACFGKYFDSKGIILHTEKVFIAQYAKKMFESIGINGKIFVKGTENKRIYEFAVKQPNDVDKALALFGHTGEEPSLHIRRENLVCGGCFAAFLAAAFLCCGTVTNPESDYSLEFSSNKLNLIKDLKAILEEKGFAMKYNLRKGNHILYVKASTQIEDLLTTMGASNSSLELMEFKIYKDIRNRANRVANCETANISKTIAANQKTIEAVEYLKSNNALEALPEAVRETAKAIEENPELSLTELAAIITPRVSKSGLSHRLKKIEKAAQELKQKTEEKQNA